MVTLTPMTTQQEFISSAELAERLGIHWRTLLRICARGDGPPAYRIGHSYRFREAEVEQWLREVLSAVP